MCSFVIFELDMDLVLLSKQARCIIAKIKRLVVSENQFFISFILCCLNGAKILTLNLIKLKCKGEFNTWVNGLIFEANLFCKT